MANKGGVLVEQHKVAGCCCAAAAAAAVGHTAADTAGYAEWKVRQWHGPTASMLAKTVTLLLLLLQGA
jgi:Zn-dependent membrane protease YugP